MGGLLGLLINGMNASVGGTQNASSTATTTSSSLAWWCWRLLLLVKALAGIGFQTTLMFVFATGFVIVKKGLTGARGFVIVLFQPVIDGRQIFGLAVGKEF